MLHPSIESLLLVMAISIDVFVGSFAYGADKIKIPFKSSLIINSVCSTILLVSIFLGGFLNDFISQYMVSIIAFCILSILGVFKLFDGIIKNLIVKYGTSKKKIKFSLFSINFVLNIYANPEIADMDHSKNLSSKEAVLLALALSIDGIVAGVGAGLHNIDTIQVFIYSFVIGMLAVFFGSVLGNKIAKKMTYNLSWISGIILIILAITKL